PSAEPAASSAPPALAARDVQPADAGEPGIAPAPAANRRPEGQAAEAHADSTAALPASADAQRPSAEPAASSAPSASADAQRPPDEAAASPLLSQRFDPRALVLAYLLLSTSMLAGDSWLSVGVSALVAAAIVIPLRETVKPWRGAIRAYAGLLIVMSVVAGIGVSPLVFDADKTLETARKLLELLFIMLLGMPFLALITPLRLQRAIEQTFGWLGRFGVPVTPVALTVTMMFRFIPMLTEEWGRFALIAQARGKAAGKPGRLPVRMLASAVVPYLRSMIRMAEQMAAALEARGIGHPEARPTRGFKLIFGRADIAILSASLLASIILYAISL
ncbi:energy-coupling factor transporter transmembrane component T, partial [Paenibacillus thailandensis]